MPPKAIKKNTESDETLSLKLAEIDAKLDKLLKLQETYENLEKVISMQNDKIEKLESENSELFKRLSQLDKKMYQLGHDNVDFKEDFYKTEVEKNSKKVEIKGVIAENPKEAIEMSHKILKNICDVPIKSSKIVHYPKKNTNNKAYSIVAKFHTKSDAISILKNRKKSPSNTFINECLTKPQLEVFKRCLALKKEKKLQACFTRGGVTFVMVPNSDKRFIVRDLASIPHF